MPTRTFPVRLWQVNPVRSTGKKTQPHHPHSRNTKKPSLTVPESPHCRAGNQPQNRNQKARLIHTRITAQIGRPGHPRIGNRSAPANGKAAPHPGAANTQTHRLKEKLSEHPGNPTACPTLTRIARLGRPGSPAAGTLLGGRDRGLVLASEVGDYLPVLVLESQPVFRRRQRFGALNHLGRRNVVRDLRLYPFHEVSQI